MTTLHKTTESMSILWDVLYLGILGRLVNLRKLRGREATTCPPSHARPRVSIRGPFSNRHHAHHVLQQGKGRRSPAWNGYDNKAFS